MIERATGVWLSDIRDEIKGIRMLTAGSDGEAFAGSWAMKRAVEHALLIIAEAAKHVPQELRTSRPDVPWQKIHGLGNLLRHEYRRIDPSILWSVITDHLDDLDNAVTEMLADRVQTPRSTDGDF